MKQNKFDIVMDYIDANILEDAEALKKGIYKVIGYNSNYFENCFKVLTDQGIKIELVSNYWEKWYEKMWTL